MTAVRGPYNKSSQRIPLTDDQLETLAKGFIEHRKTVPCPHCKIPTVFRTKAMKYSSFERANSGQLYGNTDITVEPVYW
ncbi:hypothetical protein G6F43_013049 [Rhizopus delemar]|nr:hypothetical protein G6F43_013049 [Rhizopus delemar]